MGKKRGFLLSVECQGWPVNVKGMLQLKNYSFTTTIIKICLGKNHPCMLTGGRNFEEEQDNCMVLKCILTDCLLIARVKIIAIQWRNKTTLRANNKNYHQWRPNDYCRTVDLMP